MPKFLPSDKALTDTGSAAATLIPYLDTDGETLTYEAGFSYDAAADKLTVANVTIGTTPIVEDSTGESLKIGIACEIGEWPTNSSYAFLGHTTLNQHLAGNYAIIQHSLGETNVNAAAGKNLSFRINNSNKMQVEAGGNIKIFTDLEIDGALNHDGSTAGFFATAPVSQPSEFTLTYSTESKTHANPTVSTLVNSTTGAAVTTLLRCDTGTTIPVNKNNVNDNFATLVKEINACRVDIANVKQVLNAAINDDKDLGLKQIA